MEKIQTDSILDDYAEYRKIILEEAELVLKSKKRYIQTESIAPQIKLFTLDEMADFFYLEDEHEIVNEFIGLRKAVILRHFLRERVSDI